MKKSWLQKSFLLSAFLYLSSSISPAFADSPLAVLSSERNQAAYSEQHIGEWADDWNHFQHTFETANVRYDQLKDADLLSGGVEKLKGYNVIVLPLLVDLPSELVSKLKDYVKQGGKLLITDSCGTPSPQAAELIALSGCKVLGHNTSQSVSKLVWPRQPFPLEQDFSVGTLSANLSPLNSSDSIARWSAANSQELGTAIAGHDGNYFIGWAPGMQGELSSNAQIISLILEEASPGITQKAAVQISYAEYQTLKQELQYLEKRTDEVIKTAKQADIAVPFSAIQENYDAALAAEKSFEKAYEDRRFLEADQLVQKARQELALAFAKAMPVRPVEQRSVWLDRGTIIANQTKEGISNLFDKLKAAGINAIYFEVNNAGFTMYPSKIYTQNPQLKDHFDVMGCALEEAHKRGMEFHAWIWVFNVGNERHNPIIGKDTDFPGPVLEKNRFSWALAGKNGSLLAHNQHEYWLDPAQNECKKYIKDLAVEIVSNYAVDGFQYDYIRYPFNMTPNEMGWDWSGRLRFERETGLSLDNMDNDARQVWQAWRIAQVNGFVQDTSALLRKIRPGIRISAAVYGYPRRLRCGNIQQDWETWVQSGWLDTVNPMTYKDDNKEFQVIANNCREYSEDKALVFPGISIRQLDTAGFIEQLDSARAIGSLGTTLFAVAQLDDKKLNLLKIGPYRKQAIMTPQSDPIKASTLLVDDFVATVNRYMQDPSKRVISDTASTNEVVQEIDKMQKSAHELNSKSAPADIENLKKEIVHLRALIKDWLRIDAFAQRGFRAQYIISYLAQIESILTYAGHKASTHGPSVATPELPARQAAISQTAQ
ncbi:MAG: family 10 glycosylhydrolase [Candidatus Obscuribacterales bacterium]|nr:family 10 glycosylhydrolase [Candidatus Obscuribacterales bacterium]